MLDSRPCKHGLTIQTCSICSGLKAAHESWELEAIEYEVNFDKWAKEQVKRRLQNAPNKHSKR